MPIEKNGACPVMRCGGHAHTSNKVSIGCGVEFCWICEQVIKGGHSCNIGPKTSKAGGKKTDKENFEYLGHYYRRYQHHDEAKKFNSKERAKQQENVATMECKMAELQKDGASRMYLESVDPSYLVDACELLISARRKLKWTFAHAYFLETSAPKSFFEFLQGSLEEDVEGLTDLIENKLPVQSDHSTAGDEAFVEERQRHRQLVLGGILKVKKRLAHLQDKALETKADPQGDDSEKVAFMSTKSELHSIYKKK